MALLNKDAKGENKPWKQHLVLMTLPEQDHLLLSKFCVDPVNMIFLT